MTSATLLLIRHGHTGDNDATPIARLCGWTDPPLSPLGRDQVARLSTRLAGRRHAESAIDALYASPLRRALTTAQALGRALQLTPRLLPGLREINCGELDGLSLDQVKRLYPLLWQANLAQTDDSFRWPGGESYAEFRARCLDAVRGLAEAHPGGRVIVVTHAGVITQVLGALRGTPAARWSSARVGNASISEIRWCGHSGAVMRVDDRDHLAASTQIHPTRASYATPRPLAG